ncbi:MAG: hypothetical protein GXY83_18850 [Rhodopirellula sp.]|nr:hypothetical protein [Rhodopirellula sp.]
MAKRKPVSAEVQEATDKAQVQEATAKLRTYHQLGLQLLKKRKSDSRRWADMQAICERTGLPAHQIRTLRAFAATYTPDDLKQLCGECRQHDRVIGLTVVKHLVKFDDKRQRAQFQLRLIAGAWSNVRIVAELKRELRPSWKGGRKPTIGEDKDGVLLQLKGFSISWRRWSERFADADDNEVKVRPADLAPEVRAAMRRVTETFEVLSDVVSKRMEQGDGSHRVTSRGRRTDAKSQIERP